MMHWNIFEFMYLLAQHSAVILASLAFAVSFTLVNIHSKANAKRILSHVLSALFSLTFALMVIITVWANNYNELPDVVGMSNENAVQTLQELGFETEIISEGGPISNDSKVIKVESENGGIEKKGSKVTLTVEVQKTVKEDTQIEVSRIIQDTNDVQGLVIDDYNFFKDGYYYEEPTEHWFISFSAGISGSFHYKRELTEDEKANWGHGGSLYDSTGNEIEGASFWSDMSGHFAMELPTYLPSGKYTYLIRQYINNIPYCAYIEFII